MGGTNVWDAEWEVNEEQARTLIGRQFPQLSSKQVKRLGWGWDNTVFLIGDEYVFRFPRRTIAVGSIRMEGKLLPKAGGIYDHPLSETVVLWRSK